MSAHGRVCRARRDSAWCLRVLRAFLRGFFTRIRSHLSCAAHLGLRKRAVSANLFHFSESLPRVTSDPPPPPGFPLRNLSSQASARAPGAVRSTVTLAGHCYSGGPYPGAEYQPLVWGWGGVCPADTRTSPAAPDPARERAAGSARRRAQRAPRGPVPQRSAACRRCGRAARGGSRQLSQLVATSGAGRGAATAASSAVLSRPRAPLLSAGRGRRAPLPT